MDCEREHIFVAVFVVAEASEASAFAVAEASVASGYLCERQTGLDCIASWVASYFIDSGILDE
jgi:hypothetical protein